MTASARSRSLSAPEPSSSGTTLLAPAPGGAPRARVLLATPDAALRGQVEAVLGRDFEVQAVSDEAAALAVVRRDPPSLVLVDVAASSSSEGSRLLAEIRADDRTRTTPVILLSSDASEDATVAGLLAGADDYLVRPVRAGELLARIRSRLMMAELRGQAARLRVEAEAVREREARRHAEEANRIKDEFIATLSHELRTPLSAIVGWSAVLRGERSLLAEGSDDPALVQKALEVIDRSARAQVQIIEDVLDMSRVITGKMTIHPAPNDLGAIVREAVDAVEHVAAAKGVTIRLGVEGPCFVVCDAGRMRQVASNLLSNAVRFTEESGGRVDVSVRPVGGEMEIVVADNGKGIEPEFLPHVWERFRQADGSTSRPTTGLGLGLAIVRHIVEMHGGSATATSDGPGRGATFRVRIPIACALPNEESSGKWEGDAPRLDRPARRAAVLRGRRIMLVDDEPDSRELLAAVLELAGAIPVIAPSATEALRMIEEEHPDVVVSDICMPGHDGYWFIEQLRRSVPPRALPAVALTAYARGEDVDRALEAGFQHHVAKPVEPDDLISVLVRAISNREQGTGNGGG